MSEGSALGETVAWFHCFSGIAGDMAMGALVDAGADLAEVRGRARHAADYLRGTIDE